MVGLFLLGLLLATYWDHFDNAFAFDDAHTIVNNGYIRDLGNIPRFFTDAATHTSHPANQHYRPMLSASFALDYWLAGDALDPRFFHGQTFFWYVLQLALIYFLFRHIFDRARAHRWNGIAALVATAFYGFHTANAETLNYIYARSDSLSTFWLVAALTTYVGLPGTRRRGVGLFLLPLLVALFVKQAALIFPGLLFLYAMLFEAGEKGQRLHFWPAVRHGLQIALPSLLLCAGFFWLQHEMNAATLDPGGRSRVGYLITQPWVTLLYFANFLLPVQLTADTDQPVLTSIFTLKFLLGAMFVGTMLATAWLAHRQREWRPVAFGIAWFFVALLPSSSIIPFAEVMNDHRTFLPYIGLVAALVWAGAQAVYWADERKSLTRATLAAVLLFCGAVIAAHAAGVHQRNKVWHTGETLWQDTVHKSPANGRAWMNYGLALMQRGDYDGAERSFVKALELWPRYAYAFVNMGVVKAARGHSREAEEAFATAIRLDPANAESRYFYGRFLADQGRTKQAIRMLAENVRLSPAHTDTRQLLMSLYARVGDAARLHALAADTLTLIPSDRAARDYLAMQPESPLQAAIRRAAAGRSGGSYQDLSLEYAKARHYAASIGAAEEALRFDERSAAAFNNVCFGSIMLGEFERGILACREALAIDPAYALAGGNLALGERLKEKSAALLDTAKENPGVASFTALSLFYYEEGLFEKSIETAQKALAIDSRDAAAHNVICAGHNSVENYTAAIDACNEAITLDPGFTLARNNLAYAQSMQDPQAD